MIIRKINKIRLDEKNKLHLNSRIPLTWEIVETENGPVVLKKVAMLLDGKGNLLFLSHQELYDLKFGNKGKRVDRVIFSSMYCEEIHDRKVFIDSNFKRRLVWTN